MGAGRLAALRGRDFAVFLTGYATSELGTAMGGVALAFAVLGSGGSVADLSFVFAARIVPLVGFLLGGGVLGDRLPRRVVMLSADVLRAAATAGLAALFLAGAPPLWALLALAAMVGTGEALFTPSLQALVPSLVPNRELTSGNALLGVAKSTATVAGPALAGVLVVIIGAPAVLAVDAGSFLVSVVALGLLRVRAARPPAAGSLLADLRAGWGYFRSRSWLWTIATQGALFNLVVWGPYLVLGPGAAHQSYAGAAAWGAVMSGYGVGSVLGGLVMVGRRPRRPLLVGVASGVGYAAPPALLALTAPLPVVIGGAVTAGVASMVSTTLWSTTLQRHVPAEALARVNSYVYLGAFALGPIGLAAAGPIAEASSIPAVLAVGAVWQLASVAVVLTLPSVRGLVDDPAQTEPERGPGTDRGTRPTEETTDAL